MAPARAAAQVGNIMAEYPLDPQLAKMVVASPEFRWLQSAACLDPAAWALPFRALPSLPVLQCTLLELSAGRQTSMVKRAFGSLGILSDSPPAGMCHETVLCPLQLFGRCTVVVGLSNHVSAQV